MLTAKGTSSNGNISCVTGPLWGETTGHRWIPLTKGCDTELPLIYIWTNWTNNRDAGDFRPHAAHYDVTVILLGIILRSEINSPNWYMCITDWSRWCIVVLWRVTLEILFHVYDLSSLYFLQVIWRAIRNVLILLRCVCSRETGVVFAASWDPWKRWKKTLKDQFTTNFEHILIENVLLWK